MENFIVKDLMVPLSEYATVPEGSTLFEAIMALEKAQEQFQMTQYHHRAVLVLDKQNRVIGKVSQLNVLLAIEPQNEQTKKINDISKFGFSDPFITYLKKHYRPDDVSIEDLYMKAGKRPVEEFMQKPSAGEYVEENTPLETAIYQLVLGPHLSLLVTSGDDIVGILRLSDVFAAIFHTMKQIQTKKLHNQG
ncbi:MAG: CBS domain-containing protein [Proteobacteria bacterium]|nr:CBS domain-containing protein [Pseudomonadota bacterium]